MAASPAQPLIDPASPTHDFLFRQAAAILEQDGHVQTAALVRSGLDLLTAGSMWADEGWKNVTHMFDPHLDRGLSGWPNAVEVCESYVDLAALQLRQEHFDQVLFYLGAASHIVQDLAEPHHAGARLLGGHRAFEHWVRSHCHRFAAWEGGAYQRSRRAADWVISNARQARPWLSQATARSGLSAWEETASVLLPLAQRTTAGFLQWFLEAVVHVKS
ncbi:MAG: zinc dependent phospholipase C family protein [Symbiobacteriia bacterium]